MCYFLSFAIRLKQEEVNVKICCALKIQIIIAAILIILARAGGFQISPEVKLGTACFQGGRTTDSSFIENSEYTGTAQAHELRLTIGMWH